MIRPVPIPTPILINQGGDAPWYIVLGIVAVSIAGGLLFACAVMWWLERGR